MRAIFIVGALLLACFSARASHIVGGEFELLHISGNTYRLNMILYFDEVNGNPGALDQSVDIRIFRKRDNFIMVNSLRLFLTNMENVPYTQPECSQGGIKTSKIYYTNTLTLSSALFNDPEGYYVAWERCCRNYGINNIYSEDPALGARYAGQTFYLEFPPVVKNGEPFINSSPRLFPPLSDYACPGKKYYVDFGGTDDDGDSLVYSIVTPLNTLSPDALPPGGLPRSGPYPDINWRPGFSLNNIMNGQPDLEISDDGFLTVTPPQFGIGLYVFAIKCEEFRDGVKIGELRRDFQMFVVDACPVAEPPQIVGRKKGIAAFSQPNQTLSVSFTNSVADADRCVEVQVSDTDSQKPEDNFQEKVSIRVIPLNFRHTSRYLNDLLPTVNTATLINGSVADFTICFPECSYVPGGNYQVGIIAYDDACSLPLSDTLVINVYVQPPVNNSPAFVTPDQTIHINEGDPLISVPILANDADNDQLDVFVLVDGFDISSAGMTLSLDPTQPGQLTGLFTWDSRCDVYDFTQKTQFNIKVIVEDRDKCVQASGDTLHFNLSIRLPGNADPVISSDIQQANEKRVEITRKIYEPLGFNVFGTDEDQDFLVLKLNDREFNPATVGIICPGDENYGDVSTPANWYLDCDKIDLNVKSVYELEFIVIDNANKCRFYKADTLVVVVNVEPPDNLAPEIFIENLNPDQQVVNGTINVIRGHEIRLNVKGTDADVSPQDKMRVSLTRASGTVPPADYSFLPVEGVGEIESTFTWNPDCSIFLNGIFENDYRFEFTVDDGRCFSAMQNTIGVDLVIKDEESDHQDFIPPNIVTPNGDDVNDYFAMVKLIPPDQYESILPKDNCIGSYVNIRIYDRWGKQVFESSDRDFKWYPKNLAAGVYYYHLTYTHRQYKGTVSVKY
ncbi:MAG: gliding motility-associated C-terminal domain-containing protein [Cyclobacteriaceae bacterium]|nr:gliding motility-associated C-terminal domain-containing protein [Cyclobacteriaceae bacterium]